MGFPLVDEKRDRTTIWTLLNMPLRALNDAGLSVTEACSLYLSRALLVSFTGTPFEPGLSAIIKKIEKALSPRVRTFLGRLPDVVRVKGAPRKNVTAPKHDEFVARLIEAAFERRVSKVLYFSLHSNREKDYELHPYHIAYADGGLYLTAYVPEYRQVRVFAVERIRRVTRARARLHAGGGPQQRGLRPLAGREPRQAGTHRDRLRGARGRLRARAHVASRRSSSRRCPTAACASR